MADDTFDLPLGIDERVIGPLPPATIRARTLDILVTTPRTEVQPTGKLADDDEVDALDALPFERGGIGQCREDLHGTQVGEQPECLAHPQQTLFGTRGPRHGRVPLRTTHGTEQHRIACLDGIEGLLGKRVPMTVDGDAAKVGLGI